MAASVQNVNREGEKPRLLLLSHVNPVPRQSGQQQRVYYTLVALRKCFHVTFVGFEDARKLEGTRTELLQLCDEVQLLPAAYTRNAFTRVWHRAAGWVHQRRTGLKFSNYVIGRLEFHPRRLAPLLAGRKFSLALVEYFYAAEITALFQGKNIPCVLDMHNVLWRSYARQLGARGMGDAKKERAVNRYRAAEEKSWACFDALIAISAGERDYVNSRLVEGQQLFYAPMGIPLENWPYGWKNTQPPRIAYYGGLGSPHNAADALRCHENIMPAIWNRFADAEFWIIGSNPPPELCLLAGRDSRVKITGFVDRVQDVLKTVSVLLCPFTGTYGFRSRLIEGMAMGIPVVATPDAVHGMGLEEHRGLFLAGTDEGMAIAALRLLTNPDFALAQSREARTQIEESYSFEKSYGQLARELLAFAAQRGGSACAKFGVAAHGSVQEAN